MRTAALVLTTAALLTATACGSDTSAKPDAGPKAAETSSSHSMPGMDMDMDESPATTAEATSGATSDAARTTLDDAATYAARLEQVFFSSGYPKDVAGAKAAAAKLTDLHLAPGNSIATYKFNASDQEFQLCVENTGGAWSTYDTRPMSTIRSGDSGGCPAV